MTLAPAANALAAPHGGALVDRYVSGAEADDLRLRAPSLPSVVLSEREVSDAHMIAQGAFSPIGGFMGSADYLRVVEEMRLADGLPWPLPVTLSVSEEQLGGLADGAEAALRDADGALLGTIVIKERFAYDKRREAQLVYGTTDEAHPGVAGLYAQGGVLLGGPIAMLEGMPPIDPAAHAHYRRPAQVREALAERGWRTVVGFQTRNPVHRAHEYIQKTALETADGLLLHPLVGATKADDIPTAVRMRCYQALIDGYYPADRVLLSVFPAFMRYAGPREAIFHAIVRKNYGCSHFIVGRDHAGVGAYYGAYDAQHIFSAFPNGELGVTPLFFENSFYCSRCGAMATSKTCPHPSDARVSLSGTQVREMLANGQVPPDAFTRPEVAQVLIEAYRAP